MGCDTVKPIKDGDPRYNLTQDLIEGDRATHDAAALRLDEINDLIKDAGAAAEELTRLFIPEDLRVAGYRFVFDTTPNKIKEH